MARMFPDSLKNFDFKQPGEERVFSVLKSLPDDNRVWYEVVLGVRSRKPDFLVLDPNRGLIILEVKDWGKTTILKASEREFRIKTHGNNWARQKNPDRKCRIYIEEAMEELESNPVLVDERDRLLFPVVYFVVFPNLGEQEFQTLGLEEIIAQDHVIFQSQVGNRTEFIARMHAAMPTLAQPMTTEMIATVRKLLQKEVTIASSADETGLLPGVLPEGEIEVAQELSPDVFAIDIEQEALAKSLGQGPRLLRGIAGTGKTLIMLMRAKLMASNAEAQGHHLKVLVLCWNVSLANYMRQAFDHINIPLNKKNAAKIVHFSEFAFWLVSQHPEVPKFPRSSDSDFEEKVTAQLQSLKIRREEKYDLIIVDEAQDFEDEWLKFLFHKMLKGEDPKEKNLLLAADDAQRIYKSRNFTWASLGIPMTGDRSRILRKVYRNSARVWGFAGLLFGDIAKFYDGLPKLEFSPKRGIDPRLIQCKNHEEQIEMCVKEIRAIGQDYSWRNVLIIYRRIKTPDRYPIVEKLIERLEAEQIPYQWITESREAKGTFHWAEDSVKISTAHSAKGLDAPKVIVLCAESFDPNLDALSDETKLLYVTLTRAREELVILYKRTEGLVPELQRAMQQYQDVRSHLITFEQQATKYLV
jgi:hypothetical protein